MIVFGAGDIVGIATTIAGKTILLPSWAWFTVGTVGLFIAQFLSFHKVRLERDKKQRDLDNIERELTKPFLEDAQKKHLDEVEMLIKEWKDVLVTPELYDVYPGTSSPTPIIEARPLFGCLSEHLNTLLYGKTIQCGVLNSWNILRPVRN
jgi:hypothetical protein